MAAQIGGVGVLEPPRGDSYGRGTVKLASAGIQATGERAIWAMRQERRSPAYTTCWEEMLEVGDISVISPPMTFSAYRGQTTMVITY